MAVTPDVNFICVPALMGTGVGNSASNSDRVRQAKGFFGLVPLMHPARTKGKASAIYLTTRTRQQHIEL
jgi:hypothetical protein